jgi:hypothetical protein
VESSSLNSLTFEDAILYLKKLRKLPVCCVIQCLHLAEDTALLESNRSAVQGWKQGRGQYWLCSFPSALFPAKCEKLNAYPPVATVCK